MKGKQSIEVILFVMLCCLAGCAEKETVLSVRQENEEREERITEDTKEVEEAVQSEKNSVYVYICGCVNEPGVYELDETSRIWDAIQAAGGTTSDAREEALNQAEHVVDGQTIYVPTREEETSESLISDSRININEATKEEWMTLPGIGESKAESILEYRKENGAFQSIEDLMNIPGIKEGVFNKIKEHIKV